MNDFRPPTEHLVSEEEETQTMSPPADAVAVPADAIPVDQEEEVETEEVVEQPTEPPIEPLKPREERQADYDATLNEQYQNLFSTKAVENANESKAKLERLQKEQSDYDKEQSERRKRKQNEELINSESYKKQLEKGGYITKQFDYKHVEITHPDGRVESHPYSEINKHYGDVDEYVKRWRGKAKIVDKTPPEEKEQVTALDPDVQARLDKEEKERKDEIKRLEKYLSDRDADIADYEVHNKYKDEYVKSKELMTTLNSIDENSDRTKKIAANEVFGSIRDKIESDLWGTLGEEDALTIVLPTIAKDPESESSKEYMQKYFNNDKEFYEKFAEYITSEGETFDYDYIKKIDPQGIPRHIQAAKDKEQELFFIENEYDPKQRRATSQFIIEHTLGPDALDPFKNYHNQQISDFQNLNYGDAKTRDAFGLLQDKKLAMQGQFYEHGALGEMGTAGQYSSASPLTRAEQKAFITQEYEKLKATNTKIDEDIAQLNTDKQIFEQELAPYTERQNKAAKRIKEIESMGINKDSPPELINEYNGLVNEIKAVQTELTDLGFVERETKLLDRIKLIQNQQDVAMHQASKINDLNAIVKVGLKNFSNVDRTFLQLESAFLGGGAMLTTSAGRGVTYAITELGKATDLLSDEEASDWMEHANSLKGTAVDYNEQLRNTLDEKYVSNLTTDDVSWTNLDTYMSQMFANNSPSILTTLLTLPAGGMGGLAFKGGGQTARLLTANAIKQAGRGSQAAFFTMGYGGKMADLEIMAKNAVDRKKTVADSLESGFFPNTNIPLTEYQRQQFENELTELNRQVSMPQWQRSTSSMIAGLSDMYMEKLGSLSYVNKFTRIAPVAGASTFKKMMYGGLNATLNVGTEFGEELGVQLINNASDIVMLGEDKSLLDGVNKDFFANTAFTSLAIQGPGMGGNAYNIIADEVKNQSDRQRSLKRRNELIEIEDLIRQNRTTMSQSDVKDLVDRKREILEQEALDDVMTVQKVARMSDQEKADLFELNRKRRSALKDIRAEAAKGNNKVAQQQKNKLVQKFKKIDAQRNELLSREAKARQEKAKENFDPAQYEHNMGLNDFYTDLVEMNQRQNGNKFRRFTEANPPTIENLTRDGYSQEDADAIISSYKSGSNAANIGNDILIFQDNIDVNMANTQNTTESEVAAVSPMHELLHIQNRNAGIVRDGEVVSQAKIAINQLEQTMDTKLATGRITQEQFDNFKQRKDLYTTKDGVDVEELLNIYGDFVSIGALTSSDLNPMYGIKNTLSSLVNKFNPTNQSWLMPMKTGKDVFGYLNNFQKSARNMKVSGVVDQEEKEVRESLAQEASQRVQELYDQQGEAAAMDIIDQFKPIVNKIVDKRKEAPGFDRQLLTDEIETGERGLFDLIRSYDPDSGVPLAAYINKFLPSRAIEASKRVLGEQFEEDVAEAKGIVAEEQDIETAEQKPKTAIKLKNRLTGDTKNIIDKVRSEVDALPIDQLSFKSLKNIATNEVQELFGITPKPGNLTKQDVANAQQYINKNADALIAMLPEGATPSGTSTGVQKVLLDNFYKKTGRASMAKTGSKAGLNVFEKKKNINPKAFKEVFGITPAGQPNVSDRNTSARIKALVDQTERMLTNQEVREALQEQRKEIPQALVEGKSQIMFSKSINNFTPAARTELSKVSNLRDINSLTKELQIAKATVNDKNRKERQLQVLTAIKDYNLTSNVFEAAMPASGGAIRSRVGKAPTLDKFIADNNIKAKEGEVFYKLTNGDWIRGTVEGKRTVPPAEAEGKLVAARGRLYYGKSDPAYQAALKATIKDTDKPKRIRIKKGTKIDKAFYDKHNAQSIKNMDILEDIVTQLGNAVNRTENPMDPSIAALLLAQGYQATDGIIKISAPFTRVSKTMEYGPADSKPGQRTGEKFREEHNPPASVIGASLIWAIKNNKVGDIFPFIRDNFDQTQLSKADDHLLDMAKLDATMPEGTSILDNPIIRLSEAGINLNNLIDLKTGKTVAETLGLNVPSNLSNNSLTVNAQNKLAKEIILEGKSQDQATKELQQELKLIPDQTIAAKENVSLLKESKVLQVKDNMDMDEVLSKAATIDAALRMARRDNAPIKKIRVFDFDDTVARSKSLVFYTKANGEQGQLTAEEFARDGAALVKDGAVMDFSDFNIVREGERGPLFDIAKKINEARGNEDLFILTARAPQSQQAIYEFLKAEGLEFKIDNIVGLGNSTAEAKANWIIDKAAQGYNDFYFADDAIKNVQAVQDALDVIDVKSKVQQAKIKESKSLNSDFNKILQQKSGIKSEKVISEARAKVAGASKGKFKFWIPYSAEDFQGLIYPTLSKGELGDQQMAWYKQNVLDPYARGMENLSRDRLNLMNDFRALKKKLEVPKNLRKTNETGFTNEQAVRVYLYDKMGYDIPGMSKEDINDLVNFVEDNAQYKVFGDKLMQITKGDGWVKPGQGWLVGTLTTDLIDLLNTTKRDKYLQEWKENVDQIYSKDNLNKLEAIYGPRYREALENVLTRMKSGKNRTSQSSRLSNKILDYINGSNAAIMFFNTRSAILQTISAVNFVNWDFNNPLKAGKAFANQPQYWADFMTLMNSDFLRDRRQGQRIDINSNEIADAAKTAKNKAKAALAYILEKGYLPTQYADSFAIASGGATFYRNRINDLIGKGMDVAQAEAQALQEFREIAEESQQSSRPDKISQQQASDYGRLILMFANTPMQYARIQKRAFQDLVNGRGSAKANISKIIYYGFVQNLLFNALQQAVFALGFGDDDEEKDEKKSYDTLNGMLDSILRGIGVGGVAVSVAKNFILDIYERSGRSRPEYVDSVWKLTQFSPPIGSKISKIRQALWQFNSKKRRDEMFEKGFSLDNPAFEAFAKVISGTANIPLDRILQKFENIDDAFEEETEWWQTIALLGGWPKWQLEEKERKQVSKKKKKSKNKKSPSKGRTVRKRTVKKRKIGP